MTMTALFPSAAELPVIDQWDLAPPRTVRSRIASALKQHPEIYVLTVGCLALYVYSGFWTTYDLHFWINDALNRSDDALYVSIGRDPHLGAIGFYWPPLPQLIQIPFMPFLRPFGAEIMAGPLSTAVCMALTIPVLARLGQRLHLSRPLTFTFCLVFALTPDMIYTASNGMSESCFILTGSVMMLGFLGYVQTKSTSDLMIFSAGLSGVVLTRLEGPELAIAMALIAGFNIRKLRSSLWTIILIGLPAFGSFTFWLIVQWVLLKNPLFFLSLSQGGAGTDRTWLPSGIATDPSKAVPWGLGWVVILAPVLILLALVTVLTPLSRKTRGSLGILTAMSVFLAIQIYTVAFDDGFGDPRYFVMGVLFGAVAAMWLATTKRSILGRLWNTGLVGLLVVAAGTGSYALTSGRVTHVERECSYFQYGIARIVPFLGREQTGRYACEKPGNGLLAWRQADEWIDSHLKSSDRIIADNASNYAAELFTTRPKLFVVRNDRDWQKTIANPVDITYVITQSSSATSPPDVSATYSQDEGATLIGLDSSQWHLVKAFSGAANVIHESTYVQLWHFVPSRHGYQTPPGTEEGVS
jgi:hypothetical protein